MKKIRKQTLSLLGMIFFVCMVIILICSSMLSPYPTYTSKGISSDPSKPIEEEKKQVVVIDAGHGGYDEGSMGLDGTLEKNITLSIATKVQKILEQNQIGVVMTRTSDNVSWTSDNAQDLQARLDLAANVKAQAFVSIHCNFSEVESEWISGSEIYVNFEQPDSVKLAERINEQLASLSSQLKNREMKTESLHVIHYNTMPSIIVETGFLSNEHDLTFLKSENGQQLLAEAIAKGTLEYIANLK